MIVAIMPVRNEDWILGASARALLMWVDHLIILDHLSQDNSRDIECQIAIENPGRVTVMSDDSLHWEEMRHRQALLEEARVQGATHVVTIDADEILTANLLPNIRAMIGAMPPFEVMQLPWIQMRDGLQRRIVAGQWAQQAASMAFVDDSVWCWKQDGYDHHHRHPAGRPLIPYLPLGPGFLGPKNGGLMHFQMANDRRLKAKQALYLMNEVIRWPERKSPVELNKMYGPTVDGLYADTVSVPKEWWSSDTGTYEHLTQYIRLDAEPWQEAECKRLWDVYGPEKFRGLDLFGVTDRW